MRLFLLLACLFVLAACQDGVLQGVINTDRLKTIFTENFKSKDVSSLYFAIKGYKQLKLNLPKLCEHISKIEVDKDNIESVFYLTNAAALTSCQNVLNPEFLQAPVRVLEKQDATIPEIYHAVYTLKALGKGSVYDKEDALKNLIQLLKKDHTAANYGYMFLMCEHMGCGSWTAAQQESVLLQADETDGRAAHFEGGLPVTATILASLTRTLKALGKDSALTAEQALKFGEYLLSRRSVNTARGACHLLEAGEALASDKNSPLSVTIKGRKYVTAGSDSINVSITNIMGQPVTGLKEVIAQSGTRLTDDVVVLSKQPLTQKPDDKTTYVLSLSKIKTQYGMYTIALSVGAKSASLNVAVLGEVQVPSLEFGVGDVDGTTSPKVTTIVYPKSMPQVVQMDHMQRLTLKFTIEDVNRKPVALQQVFLKIGNDDDEVIFVAEPDATNTYKVDLNVGAISKQLGRRSGDYMLTLLVGDSAIASPILWDLATVNFRFAGQALPKERSGRGRGAALPEIRHVFRVEEARPARLVSDVFACACAAPLLLLLVLWARLRVNLAHMPCTLSALLFHAGLASILCLFVVFWLRLTMFETIRYLLVLGLITFISGHRLLRHLVVKKAIH